MEYNKFIDNTVLKADATIEENFAKKVKHMILNQFVSIHALLNQQKNF